MDPEQLAKAGERKRELLSAGVALCWDWLDAHGMDRPGLVVTDDRRWVGKETAGIYWNYRARNVAINLGECRLAKRVRSRPNAARSYEDWTPMGVVAHEVGHHVDRSVGREMGRRWLSDCAAWTDIIDGEEAVSWYEPNPLEAFAEAFRLFVTNPDMLRQGRPARYDFFVERMGWTPPTDRTWRQLLRSAPDDHKAAVERWIARGAIELGQSIT